MYEEEKSIKSWLNIILFFPFKARYGPFLIHKGCWISILIMLNFIYVKNKRYCIQYFKGEVDERLILLGIEIIEFSFIHSICLTYDFFPITFRKWFSEPNIWSLWKWVFDHWSLLLDAWWWYVKYISNF